MIGTQPRRPESRWQEQSLAAAEFRGTMGLFPTGVALLTTGTGDRTEAVTVNSLISVSLTPLLVLVSLRRTSRVRGRITDDERAFALHLLAEDQEDLARAFASSDRCRGTRALERLGARSLPGGGLLVDGAQAAVQCELDGVCPAGDHDLLLGRVRALHWGRTASGPLVFHRGAYARLGDTGGSPVRATG